MAGLFVTFEGPDGSGKSTQVALLSAALGDRALPVREPGGTELGERVREVLLHSTGQVDPVAEMHLFMAARAQLLADVIEPALAAGRVVIADRYHDSTLAYQGGGRGLAVAWPDGFRRPDLTFLLAVGAETGLARQAAAGRPADRLESAGAEFHEAVLREYERLAAADPGRWCRLDAQLPPDLLHERIMERFSTLLAQIR